MNSPNQLTPTPATTLNSSCTWKEWKDHGVTHFQSQRYEDAKDCWEKAVQLLSLTSAQDSSSSEHSTTLNTSTTTAVTTASTSSSSTSSQRPSSLYVIQKETQYLLSNVIACKLHLLQEKLQQQQEQHAMDRNERDSQDLLEQAKSILQQAQECISLDPKWPKAYVRLASSYLALDQVIRSNTSHFYTSHLEQNQYHSNDACNALQTALRLDPSNTMARKMLVQELGRRDRGGAGTRESYRTPSNAHHNSIHTNTHSNHPSQPLEIQTTRYPEPSAPPMPLQSSEATSSHFFQEQQSEQPQPQEQQQDRHPDEMYNRRPNENQNNSNNNVYNDIDITPSHPTFCQRIKLYFQELLHRYPMILSNEARDLFFIFIALIVLYISFGGRFGLNYHLSQEITSTQTRTYQKDNPLRMNQDRVIYDHLHARSNQQAYKTSASSSTTTRQSSIHRNKNKYPHYNEDDDPNQNQFLYDFYEAHTQRRRQRRSQSSTPSISLSTWVGSSLPLILILLFLLVLNRSLGMDPFVMILPPLVNNYFGWGGAGFGLGRGLRWGRRFPLGGVNYYRRYNNMFAPPRHGPNHPGLNHFNSANIILIVIGLIVLMMLAGSGVLQHGNPMMFHYGGLLGPLVAPGVRWGGHFGF